MAKKNELGLEKSPYLLQHKDNPVHWQAWGEAAFAAARAEGKPIFLSIGYSTCYWCHVMEKECFERADVAAVLNELFISVKVDREERPDVDEIYMDAVVAMTGHGGWPMSVFLTPEGKPFFGGTYFPRERFIPLLRQLGNVWIEQRSEVLATGNNMLAHLQGMGAPNVAAAAAAADDAEIFRRALSAYENNFDQRDGGFGGAPKFPPSMGIGLLLRLNHHGRGDAGMALEMAERTLQKMAGGGIFDHLGGGFARYSTDAEWLVPHFEKMLYDNALLAMAYSEAYQVTRKECYADVVEETLAYVRREMTHPGGGFYSAQDAGEVKREGEFYVWEYAELEKLLSREEFSEVCAVFGASPSGNFEDAKNILHIKNFADWPRRRKPLLEGARAKLLLARSQRAAPHLDDKILAGWNGLMIAAFAKAFQVFGRQEYLAAAQASAAFLQKNLWQNGRLYRRYRDGEARFPAMVDDYAFLIHGLLHLYESDFDPQWLAWAEALQELQDDLLWDAQGGSAGYFTAPASETTLIFRKKDLGDNAIPSGNSIAALNLQRLYHLTYKDAYRERSEKLLGLLREGASRYPTGFAQALGALDFASFPVKEIAITGNVASGEFQELVKTVWRIFQPNRVLAAGTAAIPLLKTKIVDGKNPVPAAYICENQACQLPVSDPEKLRAQLIC